MKILKKSQKAEKRKEIKTMENKQNTKISKYRVGPNIKCKCFKYTN